MKYITMDAHTEWTEIVVGNERGKAILHKTVKTGAKALREVVQNVRGPATIVVEESTLAGWLRTELADLVDAFIACDPRHNRLIWGAEDKNDRNDAVRLLELAALDQLKPVYHADADRYGLKELVLTYHRAVRDVARYHNRIKAKCRQHGLGCVPASVYAGPQRKEMLARFPWADTRRAMRHLLSTFDALARQRDKLYHALVRRGRRIEAVRRFQQLPGVGPVIAITVFAIVDTPFRFANKKRLWKYAGLALREKSSANVTLARGASRQGSRWLKYVVMQAAIEAIQHGNNEFAEQAQRMRQAGVHEGNARRTVARKMLATIYGIWKSGEAYQPTEMTASRNR